MTRRIALARETVDLKQRDVERKNTLLANRTGSQVDMDNALTARGRRRRRSSSSSSSSRKASATSCSAIPNLPIEKYPPYAQAAAALDQAKRDLDHTVLRAPIAGMATQVASIQMGRYVTAGTPVFSLIDDAKPWVDANPKETDITHLRVGQPVVDLGRHVSRAANSAARSRRSAPAPARSSRSCRRRTRAATGSRSCSACRCASNSRRPRTCATCAPA